jgi:diacylglycerol kinase
MIMDFINKRLSAFSFAVRGLFTAFAQETHIKIHGLFTLIVINLGFYFHIKNIEWFMVLTCITIVISLELVNSALERLCDRLIPEKDSKVKYVKDVAAGAVLVASIFSIIIGLMVFLPYL